MSKTFGNFTDFLDFSRSSGGTALRKVSYGSELVTNGTFDTDTTGWAAGGSATISVVSNKIRVTNGAAAYGYAYQSVSTVVGRIYTLSIDVAAGTADGFVRVGTSVGGNEIYNGFDVDTGNHTVNFVATTTTTWLRIGCSTNVTSEYCDYDNVSVKEVTLDSGSDDPVLFNHPADTPRIEYATDGTVKGLLIEEARTNLIARSETIGDAPWSNSWGGGVTLTADAATAPDGTTTADKLEQIDGGGDGLNVSLSGFSIDSYYTMSCFLKNEDSNKSQLNLYNNSSNEAVNVLWNGSSVSSITTTGSNVSNAGYDDVGNGWIRVYATVQVKATSPNLVLIPENITGNTGRGAYFWGAQLEQGSFATSYIPTSGATATRSADIASIAVENFGYNPDEGTVVVDVQSDNWITENTFYRVWQFDNTTNSGLYAAASALTLDQFRFRLNDSSGNAVFGPITLGSVAATASAGAKIALTYAPNDFALAADGSVIETDTSGVFASADVTRIEIGNQALSANFLNGHIRDFQYYPRRLTNRQLQELTGATNTYDYTTVEAGTITRSPVATGADLVAYSGFDSTDYLEQPYNPDLDFGNNDFCVMGWFKGTDTYGVFMDNRDASLKGGFTFAVTSPSGGKYQFIVNDGTSNSACEITSSLIGSDTWVFACVVFEGSGDPLGSGTTNNVSIYENGELITADILSRGVGGQNPLLIGLRPDGQQNYQGSLALWRISGTAPTAEQIAKIYEDEKVLFQENAQATLYGSSDAVTALAHDDVTDLLHVGTSAGRSVFQGLRRVENTTDAVGAAISANNGLVVEE